MLSKDETPDHPQYRIYARGSRSRGVAGPPSTSAHVI